MAKDAFIVIPGTQEKLYDGTIVELFRLPNLQWILHNGYYQYDGKRRRGWYFSSIPSDTTMPVFNEDLVNLRVIDTPGPQPYPPCPPHPPCPPVPPSPLPAIFTKEDKKHIDQSMLTVDNIGERDKLCLPYPPIDGKVVRVNNSDGHGSVEYYSWNSALNSWEPASLGYRYMTRQEIETAIGDDIVAITWSDDVGALVITNHKGEEPSPIQLTGVAHDPVYTQEDLTLRIPIFGKADFVMNIPRDNTIKAIRFEPEWQFPGYTAPAIVITVTDGVTDTDIAGDASSMVNIYKGAETATTKVLIESETSSISCNVKVSALLNNPLKVDNEGLWVDLSGVVGKKQIHQGYLLVADGNGEFTYGGSGVELESSVAISDLTNPEKKVVTANLIADAISAAFETLRLALEGRIDRIEMRMTEFEGRLESVEGKLDFDEAPDGALLVSSDGSVSDSGFFIGGSELSETSTNTVATESAIVKTMSWKSI